jgi:hypothetical protein
VGGWLFAIAFVLFALRLFRTRTASEQAPSQRASGWLDDSFYALRVVGLFLFGLPLWVSCTLAEPVIGDPAITYQVVNTTENPIDFFISDPRRSYPVHIPAGAIRESGTLAHGAYSVVASSAGVDVYCASVRASDLRRLHYRIVVTNAPASCR